MEQSFRVDHAIAEIVRRLRESPLRFKNYGYDIYLPTLWEAYVRDRDGLPGNEYRTAAERGLPLAGTFYSAAWELCRRGLLRPGVRSNGEQATIDGQGGNGYSFTPHGLEWLSEVSEFEYLPAETSGIASLLARFTAMLGQAFHQRAQEAVRCYGAHAYLAACTMAGAAAESIILAVAIAKRGDEEAVIREYFSSQGRRKIVASITGNVSAGTRAAFESGIGVLSYWRDNAAHGAISAISEIEAHEALARLLRLAQLATDRWDELVRP